MIEENSEKKLTSRQTNFVCIHENMKINGKYVKDIKDNSIINNIRIVKNLRLPNQMIFIEFEPDSLDKNIPSSTLLLTLDYRIHFKNEIKSAVTFVNNKTIKYKYFSPTCNVYNLITEKGDFIKIYGVDCETLSLKNAVSKGLLGNSPNFDEENVE